jgi:hypothetical protein
MYTNVWDSVEVSEHKKDHIWSEMLSKEFLIQMGVNLMNSEVSPNSIFFDSMIL